MIKSASNKSGAIRSKKKKRLSIKKFDSLNRRGYVRYTHHGNAIYWWL